jgi:hypothetical protein
VGRGFEDDREFCSPTHVYTDNSCCWTLKIVDDYLPQHRIFRNAFEDVCATLQVKLVEGDGDARVHLPAEYARGLGRACCAAQR